MIKTVRARLVLFFLSLCLASVPSAAAHHLHLIAGGLQMSECRLETLTSPEQMVDAVRRCAQENPQKPWIAKAADLVVLERDLFAIPPSEIHRVKVLLTLLEGEEIYRDPGFKISSGG